MGPYQSAITPVLVNGTLTIVSLTQIQNNLKFEFYYWEDYHINSGKQYGPFNDINSALSHHNDFLLKQKNIINVDFKAKRRIFSK
jgi:hypothetical protein